MHRASALLIALVGLLPFALPAHAWESNFIINNEERVCLIFPDDSSFAVELAEVENEQRRTRIYIPRQSGLPGNTWYFIAVADNKGIRTRPGSIEGAAAAELVQAMLKSPRVRLGYSRGVGPLKEKVSLSLDGFEDEFWTCIYDLGWEDAESPPPPNIPPASTPSQNVASLADPDVESTIRPAPESPTVSPPADAPSSFPPELQAALDEYRQAVDQKALAVAVEPGGAFAWGYTSGSEAIEGAITGALERCTGERQRHGVAADCIVFLVGDAVVANVSSLDQGAVDHPSAPEPSSHSAIQYENHWVEGREFIVGTAGDVQVWVALATDGGPHAFVYLVNADTGAHTFIPEEVSAVAIRRDRGQDVRVAMDTFSAEAYEKKERTKKAVIGALYGLSTAMANRPTPTTSTVQGSSFGHISAFGTGGYASGQYSGSYSGTITTWPTAQDHAAANARTAAQISAMNEQLQSSFDAMAQTLARRHTLPPDSFYGGIVRFKKKRGHRYQVSVPFAGHVFRAAFDVH